MIFLFTRELTKLKRIRSNLFFLYYMLFNYGFCILFTRKPEDWTLSWGGSGSIYGWGHNHRGQLGGVEGPKVKIPTVCDAVTALQPVQLIGGEQTLFALTADGKVYFE